MSKAPPTKADKFDRKRSKIVVAATAILNERGVTGMTLGAVASALDMVPPGVTYYFGRKEELAKACFLNAIERYDALIDAAEKGTTGPARVELFIRGYFEMRRQIMLGVEPPVAFFNDVRALQDEQVNQAYTDMFRRVRALLRSPPLEELGRGAENARTHLLLSQLFWSVAWLPRYDPEDYARAGECVLDILLNGLRTEGDTWTPTRMAGAEFESKQETESPAVSAFLGAATALINEHGYHGASVKRISERLNVTKGSFYHHHDTKDDVVEACFERTIQIMRNVQRWAAQSSASGWQRLCSAVTALVELQLSGEAPLLRTAALTSVPENIRESIVLKFDRVSQNFASFISDGIVNRTVRPVDAFIAAQMVTAMVNASVELPFWVPGLRMEDAADLYARPLFTGLYQP